MAKRKEHSTEDRDQQILRRLTNIEHKVDSLEQTAAFVSRADADRHFESVRKIFRTSRRRAQVYIAANGHRSVQDITKLLKMKQPNVSKELDHLRTEGLLEVIEQEGGKTYWGKKAIDRIFRISQFLMNEYKLDKNGFSIN